MGFVSWKDSSEIQVYCSVGFVSWKVPVNYKFTAVCVFCVLEGSSELLVYCNVCFVSWKVPVNFWFTAVFVFCPGRFQ